MDAAVFFRHRRRAMDAETVEAFYFCHLLLPLREVMLWAVHRRIVRQSFGVGEGTVCG
jgi:hypothetical protein